MNKMRKKILIAAMGMLASLTTTSASATVKYYDWEGKFTLLDTQGSAIFNTSIDPKLANQFQTPTTGTLAFDSNTGAGRATITASIAPFDFFGNTVVLREITLQSIGDGVGGPGTLVVGNMLADWSESNDMPVSIVWDAAGLMIGLNNGDFDDGVLDQADVASYGSIPASDGTYTDSTWGYLGLGPVPMATTEWNLTAAPDCGNAQNGTTFATGGGCLANSLSGVLPLVTDTNTNWYEYAMGDSVGIGGVPMWDGPFPGLSPNFDIERIVYMGEDTSLQIAAFNQVLGLATVPVPAAIWLFGSGLLCLIGVARRKKYA